MTEQKNLRIIFTKEADLILFDIIKKYNLKESDEETLKNLREGKFSKVVIIDHLAKNFAKEKISEKDLISSLQKDLEVSQQTAKKITEDIKNNLIPLLEKVPEAQFETPFVEKEPILERPSERPIVAPRPSLPLTEAKESLQPSWKKTPRLERPSPEPKMSEKEEKEEIKKTPKKPDVYREPTE